MRSTRITGTLAAAALGLALTACGSQDGGTAAPSSMAGGTSMSSASTPAMGMTPSMAPSAAMTAAEGMFEGRNGKKVAGSAKIDGSMVQLSGFSSDEGPDLHLYLANGTTEADVKGGVRLGAVAFDRASQSFTVPAGIEPSSYRYLVVHCDKALAVFGAAQVSQ
ncbi:DM13 domain-containing protein [Tsukamurella sp. 1534]|uniref:DM13 domain-containing protein n=1 Tax=Tsukamurella sp. 1534 TaxID=1151061 RepID=UPI0002FB1CB1|nr:DM13 domain-containing protein [Tsukamurella sp. 1534]